MKLFNTALISLCVLVIMCESLFGMWLSHERELQLMISCTNPIAVMSSMPELRKMTK